MEMKRGSDGRKSLFYLDKAVELNDYDETALIARSRLEDDLLCQVSSCFIRRCYHSQGQTAQSIADAGEAVNINKHSAPARAALGTALYSAGLLKVYHARLPYICSFYRATS